MQTHRILSGLTVFLMVVLVAAGWFLVAQPQTAAADTANKALSGVQSQISTTQATITRLIGEQKKLPSLSKDLADLRLSIPAQADTSAYIKGLDTLAASAGVTITDIKVDDAQAYSPPASAAVTAAPATGATPAPTPAPTPTATPTAAAAPTGWSPPSDARITAANFIAIPVAVTTDGDWPTTLAFIKGLQSGTRLLLVTGISTELDTTGVLKATVKGYIYVLLDPASAKIDISKAAAQMATPTPAPTPTVSVTPSPSGSATPTPTPSPTPAE